jgi:hypothetical protein
MIFVPGSFMGMFVVGHVKEVIDPLVEEVVDKGIHLVLIKEALHSSSGSMGDGVEIVVIILVFVEGGRVSSKAVSHSGW